MLRHSIFIRLMAVGTGCVFALAFGQRRSAQKRQGQIVLRRVKQARARIAEVPLQRQIAGEAEATGHAQPLSLAAQAALVHRYLAAATCELMAARCSGKLSHARAA